MKSRPLVFAACALVAAAGLASLVSVWAVHAIERRTVAAVKYRLLDAGIHWATVSADGLRLRLEGTAPNEAMRFRALNVAGSVIDAGRIRDGLDVAALRAPEPPRFSVEILRNEDGLSLIGLLPGEDATARGFAEAAGKAAGGAPVSDMLETANWPSPEGWQASLDFGLAALKLLPRSKVSIAADRVRITAISDSAAQKRRLEADLARMAPDGLVVETEISAPRPVLTPFTLRFVMDEAGARFDACSADTDRARARILAAGVGAGAKGAQVCTVGLGVPTPRWAEAVEAAIGAVAAMGSGTVTFSDADVTLLAGAEVPQARFDHEVGELQTALPAVFSLTATLEPRATPVPAGPAEFTAALAEGGRVELRGRLTDDRLRGAADRFARARFGSQAVHMAARLDPDLPAGWAVRVLSGLESLALLDHGSLLVREDTVEVTGVTGQADARARIAQILSDRLGPGQTFRVSVRYDEALDPMAALPAPEVCVERLNATLATAKIGFAPGSSEIEGGSAATIGALAEVLKDCPPLTLEIAGHTDSQGSESGNAALSQARAEAVLTALAGRRVATGGFVARGYGEARPIADNATEAGREANRRIEFALLGAPAPAAAGAAAPAAGDGIAVSIATATAPEAAPAAPDRMAPAEGEPVAMAAAPAVDPVNGATRSVTLNLPEEEALVFAPSEDSYPRPIRRPDL